MAISSAIRTRDDTSLLHVYCKASGIRLVGIQVDFQEGRQVARFSDELGVYTTHRVIDSLADMGNVTASAAAEIDRWLDEHAEDAEEQASTIRLPKCGLCRSDPLLDWHWH